MEYMLEQFNNQGRNNQIYLSYRDKISKMKREEYYPDDKGLVIFHSTVDWSETGYSVYEMLEFLRKYGDRIKKIMFDGYDGKPHSLISIYESDLYSLFAEYSCVIKIGTPGKSILKQEGKVLNNYSVSDMMYTGILHN